MLGQRKGNFHWFAAFEMNLSLLDKIRPPFVGLNSSFGIFDLFYIPVISPNDNSIIAKWDIRDREGAGSIGNRIIGIFSDKDVSFHPRMDITAD